MNFNTNLYIRRIWATMACVLFLVLLIMYVTSEKQRLVYDIQDSDFKSDDTSVMKTEISGPTVNKQLDHSKASERSLASREHIRISETQKHLSTNRTPNTDLMKLIETYQRQDKLISSNISNFYRNNKQTFSSKTYQEYLTEVNYPPDQRERIKRIKRTCNDKEFLHSNVYRGRNSTRYYYSSNYNFSYCKVPKSGSTFWTQAFNVLKYGANVSKTVFMKGRSRVHGSMGSFLVKFKSDVRTHSLSILVSRNPFSRLYSAYIDKSYLLLDFETNFEIRNLRSRMKNKLCPVDVTFQEFLDFVILRAKTGKTLDRHWATIFSLCRPCDVNAYILVKQESFSEDVQKALKAFRVEDEKLDVILSALHDHRVESTIPGVIQTVYNRIQHGKSRLCMDGKSIAMRLWTSFKIQGYIKNSLKFPSQMFKNKYQYSNKTFVTGVILNSIKTHKLTSPEMKIQRHKALVDAYSEIKYSTIEGIKEVYKIDFKMFGYNTDPP